MPLLGEQYWQSTSIVPVVLLTYVFLGIFTIQLPGIYIQKKSKWIPIFTGSAAFINIIFNIENQAGNDFIHQRNSGLNHILCNLAHKNNKIIGTSFSNLLNNSFNPQLLGRIYQNFSLCKKYNVKTIFASFATNPSELRSPSDLRSFLLSLGVENNMARESMLNLSSLIDLNKKRITEHIKIE